MSRFVTVTPPGSVERSTRKCVDGRVTLPSRRVEWPVCGSRRQEFAVQDVCKKSRARTIKRRKPFGRTTRPVARNRSSGKTRSDGSSRGQDCWVDEGVLEGGREVVGEW
jgi:hypothetical protein